MASMLMANIEVDWDTMTNGGSGRNSPALFAIYDPDTSSWKTSSDSDLKDSPPYAGSFPNTGMIVSGRAYRLGPLVPHTIDGESTLWPTPTAQWRPCEGNVRAFRRMVQAGLMTEPEARAMLNGKSPFSKQGKIPAIPELVPESSPDRPRSRRGHIDPRLWEWLMGYPEDWTDLEPLGTLSSHRSANGSAASSTNTTGAQMSIRKDGKLRKDPTKPEQVSTTPEGEKLAAEKARKEEIKNDTLGD